MKNFAKQIKSAFQLATAGVAVVSLVACGGGDNTADTQQQSKFTPSSLSQEQIASLSAAELNTLVATAPSDQAASSDTDPKSDRAKAMTVDPDPPASCSTMYFGTNGVRCFIYGSPAPNGIQGTGPSTIASVNQWCPEIPVGQLLQGVTPPPGSLACYQFVVNASTAINFQAQLPAGVVGIGELFNVNTNGSGFMIAKSTSPTAPLSGTATTQYLRLVLVIRTSNGTGGQVFGYGINLPSAPTLASNTTSSNAHVIDMNEEVSGTLVNNTDSAYYFYPLKTGQTKALISVTFNGSNQVAAFSSAQKTGPNTYSVSPETPLSSTQSGTQLLFTSTYAANTAGTTTPAGVMVRVTGTNSSAPANQAYGLRVGAQVVNIASMDIYNTESITRWFPVSGFLQAANYISTYLGAIDDQGAWVKNQPVQLTVQRFNNDINSRQVMTVKTNIWGRIADTPTLPQTGGVTKTTNFAAACSGSLLSSNNYGPPGNPTDHWKGTAQMGTVSATLLGAAPVAPKYSTFAIQFTRICSETYLGYY
ncbi:hypothetical protein EIP75_20330 [Aquabacterium soli]|uniref:Lipoprotein n=1 Tax=Aquabacterium soli TaxID=2493092 RepID=A0A426V688_9BURK|nr:hypothetical protein [Aquabacterium soli]RRS02423.1 hypothetical protein EIP75_20330 [Aquabacterium soli]